MLEALIRLTQDAVPEILPDREGGIASLIEPGREIPTDRGVPLGFVLRGGAFEAEAKPPPETQLVEEQNVDANDFIRVHEQGVADVNVTNATLPVSGTVNVGNLPAVPSPK